jgi:hypothetical protein
VKNAGMNSRCWSLERMKRSVPPAGRKTPKRRCPHSVFPWVTNLHRRHRGKDHPARAAVPQIAQAVLEAAAASYKPQVASGDKSGHRSKAAIPAT